MATYMTYEDSLKMAQKAAFQDYKFLDNNTVQEFIDSIPQEYSRARVGPVSHPEGINLSSAEFAKLSPAAKVLNLADTKKAEAIRLFVSEHFARKLEAVSCDNSNCIFEAVRCQFGNKDSMLDENNTKYTATHLRLQTVAFAAQNYIEIHKLIGDHIDLGLKDWCQEMLDSATEGDFACLTVMQRMTKVSLSSFYF